MDRPLPKNFHFFLSKDEILVKKTPTSLHEKKIVCRQWTLILIFCVDVHMGLDPSHPPSTCVHLSLTPPPPPCGRHKWMAPHDFDKTKFTRLCSARRFPYTDYLFPFISRKSLSFSSCCR